MATSREIPYSISDDLVVVSGNRVCVTDTYEVQIVCGDRTFSDPQRFGKKGEGPGEFEMLGRIMAAGPGRLAHTDLRGSRVSFVSDSLEFLGSAPFTQMTTPMGEIVNGVYTGFRPGTAQNPNAVEILQVRVADDSVLSRLSLTVPSGSHAPVVVRGGLRAPDGTLLLLAGRDSLVRFDASGTLLNVLTFPHRSDKNPDQREVARYAEGYQVAFGRPIPEDMLNGFRNTSLGWIARGSATNVVQIDGAGRIWAITNLKDDDGTLLAILDSTDFLGALEVSGRALAIQVRDDMLVALVEAMSATDQGLYPRRLEWYRIEEVPAGVIARAQ